MKTHGFTIAKYARLITKAEQCAGVGHVVWVTTNAMAARLTTMLSAASTTTTALSIRPRTSSSLAQHGTVGVDKV